MANCPNTYEPATTPRERAGTHTCDLDQGHATPHRCPTCGVRWITEPGQRRNRVIPDEATP